MEIPSPMAGQVKELRIKVGDKVSKGAPIMVLAGSDGAAAAAPKAPADAPKPAAAKAAPAAASAAPAAGRNRLQAARQPRGAQVRTRARRRAVAGQGQRPEGTHPA